MRGRAPRLGTMGRTGSKRIKGTKLSELVGRQVQIETGRVYREPDEAERWSYVAQTGEFHVSVRMDRHEVVLWALWSPGILGPLFGVMGIPPEGAEVVVGFPDGDYEGDPVILGVTTTGDGLPVADLQDGRLLVMAQQGGEVWAYDGTGTPKALATKDDIDALASHVDQHRHEVQVSPPAFIPTSVPSNATAGPIGGSIDTSPAAAGTEVLKGK